MTTIYITSYEDHQRVASLVESLEQLMPEKISHRTAIAIEFGDQIAAQAVTAMLSVAGINYRREAETASLAPVAADPAPVSLPPAPPVSGAGKCKYCGEPVSRKSTVTCGKPDCQRKAKAEAMARRYQEKKRQAKDQPEGEKQPEPTPFDESPEPQ